VEDEQWTVFRCDLEGTNDEMNLDGGKKKEDGNGGRQGSAKK
jgi:hypothetical protein